MSEDCAKVKELIESARQTDIPEARCLLGWLEESFSSVQRFYDDDLTSERTRLIVDDLSVLISQLSTRFWRLGSSKCSLDVMWRGHMFLDEIRQKAVALRADPDIIDC